MSNIKKEDSSKAANVSTAQRCSNCGKAEVYSKGMCQKCYKAQWYQQKKASEPPKTVKKPSGRPPVDGEKPTACTACGNKNIYARGLCYKCYKRAYQRGAVTKEAIDASYVKPRTTDPETGEKKICSYCGLHPVYSKGLCRNCHTRAMRNGGNPAYKGRSYERIMKSERLLKERRELQNKKETKNE